MERQLKYHIALSRPFDLELIAQEAQEGKRPGHVIRELSQKLKATVYQPGVNPVLPVSLFDKLSAKIVGQPEHWALARKLSSQLTEDDLIFCGGPDVGIPIATLCGAKRNRPKIVVFMQNLNRPRGRLALKLFGMAERIDLFLTCTPPQSEFLRRYLNLPENRVCLIPEQTDIKFFTPGPTSPDNRRPLIVSGGLEKRDYKTLAKATEDLDVDLKICAASPNAKVKARSFPKVMPSNMSCQFYDWLELRQLYRNADVVALSVFDNDYSAGLTTLLEAMACRRPIVSTRVPGLVDELVSAGIITGVEPGDSTGMRQAIIELLNNPQKAAEQAQRGYELVLKHHANHHYVETLAKKLMSVAASAQEVNQMTYETARSAQSL